MLYALARIGWQRRAAVTHPAGIALRSTPGAGRDLFVLERCSDRFAARAFRSPRRWDGPTRRVLRPLRGHLRPRPAQVLLPLSLLAAALPLIASVSAAATPGAHRQVVGSPLRVNRAFAAGPFASSPGRVAWLRWPPSSWQQRPPGHRLATDGAAFLGPRRSPTCWRARATLGPCCIGVLASGLACAATWQRSATLVDHHEPSTLTSEGKLEAQMIEAAPADAGKRSHFLDSRWCAYHSGRRLYGVLLWRRPRIGPTRPPARRQIPLRRTWPRRCHTFHAGVFLSAYSTAPGPS